VHELEWRRSAFGRELRDVGRELAIRAILRLLHVAAEQLRDRSRKREMGPVDLMLELVSLGRREDDLAKTGAETGADRRQRFAAPEHGVVDFVEPLGRGAAATGVLVEIVLVLVDLVGDDQRERIHVPREAESEMRSARRTETLD